MKKLLLLLVFLLQFISCNKNYIAGDQKNNIKLINQVSNQLEYSLNLQKSASEELLFPRTVAEQGEIQYVGKNDWTSGF